MTTTESGLNPRVTFRIESLWVGLPTHVPEPRSARHGEDSAAADRRLPQVDGDIRVMRNRAEMSGNVTDGEPRVR